jgi:hypothetical protein
MKKLLILLLVPICIFASGCAKQKAETQDNNVISATEEEVKQAALQYIMGMQEYSVDNGYHVEEISTQVLKCPGCFEIAYEYRRRAAGSADVTGVADVTLTFTGGKITKVTYWNDSEDIKKELPVQESPIIGGQRDEYGCLGPAGYSWCVPKQKCLRVWEEPCLEDINFDTGLIKQAFLKKYPDWEGKELVITVNKQYGDHAAGGVNFAGSDAGGGYFFAAKTEDGWVIAADGNGEIRCDDVDPYNFPSEMIPECFDTETQTMKQRGE